MTPSLKGAWGAVALAAQCLAMSALPARAQGRSAFLLPSLQRTAQSDALGDAAAYLQGLNALGVNPAGLHTGRAEALTQYQQLPLDTQLALLGASSPARPLRATLGLTYLTLRSAGFDRRDEQGRPQGEFATQDHLFGLHLSRPLRRGGLEDPLTAGVSLKFMRMKTDALSAQAWALDLGLRGRLGTLPLTLGAAALNLGKGPSFRGAVSPLPTALVVSAAYMPATPLAFVAAVTHHAAEGRREASFGMQYQAVGGFALRGRYALAQGGAGGDGGLQNLAAGAGFRILGAHTLDYSFQPFDGPLRHAGAAGTHRITLTFRLGETDWDDGARPAPRRHNQRSPDRIWIR